MRGGSGLTRGLHVLHADRDPTSRRLVGALLSTAGHRVVSFATAADLTAALAAGPPPDVVLLALGEGLEPTGSAFAIAARHAALRLVCTTAAGVRDHDIVSLRAAGVTLLPVPCLARDLVEAVAG